MKPKKSLTLLFFLVINTLQAQNRTCGTSNYMLKLLQNPQQKKEFLEHQQLVHEQEKKHPNNKNTTIVIPVAIHFPNAINESKQNKDCLTQLALSQIETLNQDYNAKNNDIKNWETVKHFYPITNTGTLNIEFVIATKNHPETTGLNDNDYAITFGTSFLNNADQDKTWQGYLNFVIRPIENNTLGYSPIGGRPKYGHTVVINTVAFGTTTSCTGYQPKAPYNLGRTLTHELGHYFDLDHTFANDDGCGTDDDDIDDTPKTANATYGCPTPGSVQACNVNEKTLTMNYMDYVNDPCMYMFTQGQIQRMKAHYSVISNQFKTNVLKTTPIINNNTEQQNNNFFTIAPIPNEGQITLYLASKTPNYTIQIIDNAGRNVYQEQFTNQNNLTQTFNLHKLAKGVYHFILITENEKHLKKITIK